MSNQRSLKPKEISDSQATLSQAFSFHAFKEILEEIDRQNHSKLSNNNQASQSQFKKTGNTTTIKNNKQIIQNSRNDNAILKQLNQDSEHQLMQDSSNNYQTYLETISTFDKGFKISENVQTKDMLNTYMTLSYSDMPLIIEAINNNTDVLRLFFGCKALRKILSVGNEYTIKEVIRNNEGLAKRLVHLLMMPQNQELQIEILWALVNLTSLKDNYLMKDLIDFGLFDSLLQTLDEDLVSLDKCELSLQVFTNCIADQDSSKQTLMEASVVKGQQRLTIKDKIDLLMKQVTLRSNEDGVERYDELLVQISVLLESYGHSYKILTKKQFRWIVLVSLEVFQMQASERVIDTILTTLKTAAQNNEYTSYIVFKHSKRLEITQKLVALSQNLSTYEIAFNALQIIGYLASSDHFQESCLVTQSNLYQGMINILTTQGSQFSAQYLQILIWTLSNLIADDKNCQAVLLQEHPNLIILVLNIGLKQSSIKVVKETQVFLDYILDIESCHQILFTEQYEEITLSIIESFSNSLQFYDYRVQITALKQLKKIIDMNKQIVVQIIVSPVYGWGPLKALQKMQFSQYQDVYDHASYLIKVYLSEHLDQSEVFNCESSQNIPQENQNVLSGYMSNQKSDQNLSFQTQKSFFSLTSKKQDFMIMMIDDE